MRNKLTITFISVGYSAAFLLLAIKYYNLNNTVADLGIYSNIIFNLSNNIRLIFDTHFQPYLILLSFFVQITGINDVPFFLICFSTFLFYITNLIIFKFWGRFAAIIFLISPLTWNIMYFDFHIDIMAIPLILIFLILLENKNLFYSLLVLFLLCLVKEIFILQAASLCLYAYVIKKCAKTRLIFILFAFIFIVFFLYVIFILIPGGTFKSDYGIYSSSFVPNGGSLYDKVINSFLNANYINDNLLNFPKFKYLVSIFLLMFFLPLKHPRYFLLFLPQVMVFFLTTNSSYVSLFTHYTAGLLIPSIYMIYEFRKK